MAAPHLTIRVEAHAGYRAGEYPCRFYLGERGIEVTEVIDRWVAPDHRYFKVRGDDGGIYIIRHDESGDRWELTLFTNRTDDPLSST